MGDLGSVECFIERFVIYGERAENRFLDRRRIRSAWESPEHCDFACQIILQPGGDGFTSISAMPKHDTM